MKTGMIVRRALIVIAAVTALAACTQERQPCLQPRTAQLRAGAYRFADTGTAILDTSLPNPLLEPLGAQQGVVFYYGGPNTKLLLHLDQTADSTRYVIQPDSANSLVDTLTIYHDRQTVFLSQACGYTIYYTIGRVAWTRNSLDSVFITNPEVNSNANVENLRLRY